LFSRYSISFGSRARASDELNSGDPSTSNVFSFVQFLSRLRANVRTTRTDHVALPRARRTSRRAFERSRSNAASLASSRVATRASTAVDRREISARPVPEERSVSDVPRNLNLFRDGAGDAEEPEGEDKGEDEADEDDLADVSERERDRGRDVGRRAPRASPRDHPAIPGID
jgi:hypothetical protein